VRAATAATAAAVAAATLAVTVWVVDRRGIFAVFHALVGARIGRVDGAVVGIFTVGVVNAGDKAAADAGPRFGARLARTAFRVGLAVNRAGGDTLVLARVPRIHETLFTLPTFGVGGTHHGTSALALSVDAALARAAVVIVGAPGRCGGNALVLARISCVHHAFFPVRTIGVGVAGNHSGAYALAVEAHLAGTAFGIAGATGGGSGHTLVLARVAGVGGALKSGTAVAVILALHHARTDATAFEAHLAGAALIVRATGNRTGGHALVLARVGRCYRTHFAGRAVFVGAARDDPGAHARIFDAHGTGAALGVIHALQRLVAGAEVHTRVGQGNHAHAAGRAARVIEALDKADADAFTFEAGLARTAVIVRGTVNRGILGAEVLARVAGVLLAQFSGGALGRIQALHKAGAHALAVNAGLAVVAIGPVAALTPYFNAEVVADVVFVPPAHLAGAAVIVGQTFDNPQAQAFAADAHLAQAALPVAAAVDGADKRAIVEAGVERVGHTLLTERTVVIIEAVHKPHADTLVADTYLARAAVRVGQTLDGLDHDAVIEAWIFHIPDAHFTRQAVFIREALHEAGAHAQAVEAHGARSAVIVGEALQRPARCTVTHAWVFVVDDAEVSRLAVVIGEALHQAGAQAVALKTDLAGAAVGIVHAPDRFDGETVVEARVPGIQHAHEAVATVFVKNTLNVSR